MVAVEEEGLQDEGCTACQNSGDPARGERPDTLIPFISGTLLVTLPGGVTILSYRGNNRPRGTAAAHSHPTGQ